MRTMNASQQPKSTTPSAKPLTRDGRTSRVGRTIWLTDGDAIRAVRVVAISGVRITLERPGAQTISVSYTFVARHALARLDHAAKACLGCRLEVAA